MAIDASGLPLPGGSDATPPPGDEAARVLEAARAGHEAMGFEAGWGASADQLAEVARRLAAE